MPDSPPNAMDSSSHADLWQTQVAAIRRGEADTILVSDHPISHQSLAELASLDGKLSTLLIDAGGVNDEAMRLIAKVHSLNHLRIRESEISDQGLENLLADGLAELRILNIPQGKITAAGISQLAKLPELVQLRLGGQQLDDLAVEEITKLPALNGLHLIGPRLTDAAIESIAQCSSLSSFYLDDCPVSDAAWEKLFAAKPKLHVHVDQQHHDRDPHPDPHP